MGNQIGIELEEGIELLLNEIEQIQEEIEVEILDSLGYILNIDVIATINNPPFNRSPLDGYTLDANMTKGVNKENPLEIQVESEIMAGDYIEELISKDKAIRIMTGAPIPKGCNCVIKQEDVEYNETTKKLKISKELKEWSNFIFEGEDFEKGDILLKKGEKITTGHIGVLASLGIDKVKVLRKVKVGLLCTGDELMLPGKSLLPGKIYNSNLYSLGSKLKQIGADLKILTPQRDDIEAVTNLIRKEMANIDVMITTGGVSVGKKDIIHDVIKELPSRRLFWKLNIKPGTPVLGSLYNGKLILSLSGNPFASIVNFELLVKIILNKLSGGAIENNSMKKGILMEEFSKGSKVRRFIRARYLDGKVYFDTTKHSSGQLSSIIGKNALIDVKAGSSPLKIGDSVEVILVGE